MAHHTALSGKRRLDMDEGLKTLAAVKEQFRSPVLADVREPRLCATEVAANLNKGQFMAPIQDLSQMLMRLEAINDARRSS